MEEWLSKLRHSNTVETYGVIRNHNYENYEVYENYKSDNTKWNISKLEFCSG